MGKLHTLRRAIEREPVKWARASGAARGRKNGWYPLAFSSSYRRFIRATLAAMFKRCAGE